MAPQCSPDSRSQFKPDYWQVLAGITTTIKRSTVVNVLSKHLQYHGNINLQYHGNINSITYLLTYTIKLYAKIRLFRKLTIYVAHKSRMNHGKLLRGVFKKYADRCCHSTARNLHIMMPKGFCTESVTLLTLSLRLINLWLLW